MQKPEIHQRDSSENGFGFERTLKLTHGQGHFPLEIAPSSIRTNHTDTTPELDLALYIFYRASLGCYYVEQDKIIEIFLRDFFSLFLRWFPWGKEQGKRKIFRVLGYFKG